MTLEWMISETKISRVQLQLSKISLHNHIELQGLQLPQRQPKMNREKEFNWSRTLIQMMTFIRSNLKIRMMLPHQKENLTIHLSLQQHHTHVKLDSRIK